MAKNFGQDINDPRLAASFRGLKGTRTEICGRGHNSRGKVRKPVEMPQVPVRGSGPTPVPPLLKKPHAVPPLLKKKDMSTGVKVASPRRRSAY